MKNLTKRLIFFSLFGLLLSGCTLPFLGSKKKAALNVTASPKASVFLDGEHIGSTPYFSDTLKPGEYTVRLVPESSSGMPWEARVKLTAGILTVVSRDLGDTLNKSSGHVLSLEPALSQDEISLLVVTVPEGCIVSVDGEPRGFAPKAIDNVSEGDHTLSVSSPGYIEKSLKAQLIKGYKLTASIQLAKANETLPSQQTEIQKEDEKPEEETQEEESDTQALDANLEENSSESEGPRVGADLKPPYVTVLDTPTGWLNVREKPSTASEILIKANPGDAFAYLEMNDAGWYKIKLDEKQEGWVSSKYVKLTKESSVNTVEDEDE
ncbi:MAG: PEGA domain-containing protein [Patescibacteria group bacterium]|jgi:hypothetical protein